MTKGTSPQVWKFYEVAEGRLKKLRRECPRCGRGVFMAQHENRYTCGRCGYTVFLKEAGEGARPSG